MEKIVTIRPPDYLNINELPKIFTSLYGEVIFSEYHIKITLNKKDINKLLNKIKKMGYIIYSSKSGLAVDDTEFTLYILRHQTNSIILSLDMSYGSPGQINCNILYKEDNNGNKEVSSLVKLLKKNFNNTEEPSINILNQNSFGFNTTEHKISHMNMSDMDLNMNYGEGFSEFNRSLLDRLKKETGLVLFHGEPGTGKTQYIKYVIAKLLKTNKVLYIPPGLASQITSPSLISFISSWAKSTDKRCIILLEDAEVVLKSRDVSNNNDAVSNILNATDGILTDVFNISFICTFNCDITKIDSALLRPKRLMARKMFSKLNKKEIEKLKDYLKRDIDLSSFNFPISLSDFYSKFTESEILTHGNIEDKVSIGFKK